MAKDKGLVRRVLQILSPEDQETLAILHDPPLMEELLRRQETLADIRAAGLIGGVVAPLTGAEDSPQVPAGLRVFPAVLDELAELPAAVREALLQVHLPALAAAPEEGLALTQLFQGLWVSICTVHDIDYRIIYEIAPPSTAVTVLLIGTWKNLERRLETNEAP
jgi:hypothetical protein